MGQTTTEKNFDMIPHYAREYADRKDWYTQDTQDESNYVMQKINLPVEFVFFSIWTLDDWDNFLNLEGKRLEEQMFSDNICYSVL